MSESKKTKIRILDMDDYLGKPNVGGGTSERSEDPLDRAYKEVVDLKVKKLKRLELDKFLRDLEAESKTSEAGQPTSEKSEISPDMLKYMMDLPDDKRQETMATYMMFRNAEKAALGGKGGGESWLLPMLIGFQRSNPNAPQGSLEGYAKIMTDQIRLGMEMAKQGVSGGAQGNFSSLDLVKTILDYTTKEQSKAIDEIVKKIQPATSPLEEIIMNDKYFDRAKSLGMFGGAQPAVTDSQVVAQLEQMKQSHELAMAQFSRENTRWEFDMRQNQINEARKYGVLRDIFGIGGAGQESPFARIISGLGDAAVKRVTPGGPGKPPTPSKAGPEMYNAQCSECSGVFQVDKMEGEVDCPHCGSKLTLGTVPDATEGDKDEGRDESPGTAPS